jgi:hypothetical protein
MLFVNAGMKSSQAAEQNKATCDKSTETLGSERLTGALSTASPALSQFWR